MRKNRQNGRFWPNSIDNNLQKNQFTVKCNFVIPNGVISEW